MSCAAHTETLPRRRTAVRVDGIAIPHDAIAREVQHHPAESAAQAWIEAARALVVRRLLLDEAKRMGLEAEVEAVPQPGEAGRRETEDEAAIRRLIDREVRLAAPDRETCRRYYEQNRRRFRAPDIYEAAHILFAARAADRDAYAHARQQAVAAIATLVEDPTRFAELARAHSDCPSGRQGGSLGQVSRGQTTPEFERALASLLPGTLAAEPVATRYGFHVVRLDRKHEGKVLPFAAVEARIADYLGRRVERQALAQYVARLASRARIEGVALPRACPDPA